MKEKVQKVSIETLSGTVLFEGFLENGRVQAKLIPNGLIIRVGEED